MGSEQLESHALIEFIQTCIVSWPPTEKKEPLTNELWKRLEEKIGKLYNDAVLRFQIANSAKRKTDGIPDDESDELYFRLVTFWVGVRGKRYLNHEKEHLGALLSPHDAILTKLYGVTGSEIAQGVYAAMIQLVSSPTLFRELDELKNAVDTAMKQKLDLLSSQNKKLTDEEFKSLASTIVDEIGLRKESDRIVGGLFGSDLFDFEKVSGLPRSLLDELSLSPGQNTEFFVRGKFAGTPLSLIPVWLRPLLKIDSRYFAYHPHLLGDHLYRAIQSSVLRLEPAYAEGWNKRQKEISEELPFKLLGPLLPGARVIRNFQFRAEDRSGNDAWIEGDGVILLDDILLVAEVKGGKMFLGPPAESVESHFDTIKNLLAEPAFQGRRLIERMQKDGSVELFDMKQRPLLTLRSADFSASAVLAVSLEQLTDISPMVHQFKKLGLSSSGPAAWVLSIDDLRVYRDTLANPIEFSHFLVERLRAFQNQDLHLDDELDHLGLYFAYNRYHDITEGHKADRIVWHGYRSELDKYFHRLLADPSNAARPNQSIPEVLSKILNILCRKGRPGFAKAGRTLLDFDGAARKTLATNLDEVAKLQSEQGRTRPFSLAGDVSLSIVLSTPDVSVPKTFNPQEYALSNMVAQQRSNGLLLRIGMDGKGKVCDVDFEWVTSSQVTPEIRQMADGLAKVRVKQAEKNSDKKKIGRNDSCPCGSGKKFKKCHGK